MRNPNCTDCERGLHRRSQTICIYGEGDPNADVMFVCDIPGENEGLLNKPLVGKTGALFDTLLKQNNIDRSKVYVTNLIKCPEPRNSYTIEKSQKAACIKYLKQEIASVKPQIIVTMGVESLKTFTGLSTITKCAGNIINVTNQDLEWSGRVFPVLNLGYTIHNPSAISKIERYFKDIGCYYRGEEPTKAPTNYTYITEFDRLEGFFKQLNNQKLAVFDLETDSLDFKSGEILCLSFSWKPQTGVVLPLVGYPDKKPLWTSEQYKYILDNLKETFGNKDISWIAHNISFDHKYLLAYDIDIAGDIYDTMLLQQLLDENALDLKGLKALAAAYTDMGRYDDPLDEFKHDLRTAKSKKLTEDRTEYRRKLKLITKALENDPDNSTHINALKTLELEKQELDSRDISISYDMIPTDLLWPYAAMDADATLRIFQHHWTKLKNESFKYEKYLADPTKNLKRLYTNLVMPLRRVLNEMEFRGTLMDEDYLHELDVKYSNRIQQLHDDLVKRPEVQKVEQHLLEVSKAKFRQKYRKLKSVIQWAEYQETLAKGELWTKTVKPPRPPKFANEDEYAEHFAKPILFNLNSPAHLRILLFQVLKCSTGAVERTTSGALSTSKNVLEMFKDIPGVANLLENRKITKLHNTYVKGSLAAIANSSDKRIHTDFNQHTTVTGRLSSSNPNLQNIPRDDKDIKKAFKASPGWGILQLDYSQAEFRMWCELSNDLKMLQDIKDGLDIHIQTACDFWGIRIENFERDLHSTDKTIKRKAKNRRSAAKWIVFGLMYGRGTRSVAEQVGISREDAETIKNVFFERYPQAAKWLERVRNNAKRVGFVPGFFGRVRRLPYASSSDREKAAIAQRQAVNSPIQGSAADVTGLGLIRIRNMLLNEIHEPSGKLYGEYAKLILTVHDSIILEVKNEFVQDIAQKCSDLMVKNLGMRTPMEVEAEFGPDWAQLDPITLKKAS